MLDVIDVPVLEARPKTVQRENWLLDPTHYWSKVGRVEPSELNEYVDSDGPLWLNVGSTRAGRNDEMPVSRADQLNSSLTLVRVPEVRISVFSPGTDFGNPKRRVQARFKLGGTDYWLWVTDPV